MDWTKVLRILLITWPVETNIHCTIRKRRMHLKSVLIAKVFEISRMKTKIEQSRRDYPDNNIIALMSYHFSTWSCSDHKHFGIVARVRGFLNRILLDRVYQRAWRQRTQRISIPLNALKNTPYCKITAVISSICVAMERESPKGMNIHLLQFTVKNH